jgi:hypothetical protein
MHTLQSFVTAGFLHVSISAPGDKSPAWLAAIACRYQQK